jgi:hypothetical protein
MIVISPLLIGLLIGVACYSNKINDFGLLLLFLSGIGGLVIGILFLKWVLKGNNAEFIAGANASRDIDDAVKDKMQK